MNKKKSLSILSLYRTELMGLATIGIILCHTKANGVVMPDWLWQIFSLGSTGTAIFFFLSGVGIWHSLQKIKFEKREILVWYIKRYKKLFVPFLILAIPYFAYTTISGGHGFGYFLFRVSTLEYWVSGEGAWFVSVIVVLYLISPWWDWLIRKTGMNVLFSAFAFLLILCTNIQILHPSRLCFYFLGFGIAPYVKNGSNIRYIPLLACSILLYIICSFVPKLDFIPRYIFLVPVFIILPCVLFDTKWFGKTNSAWHFMGEISLESYLTNIFLPVVFVHAAWIHNHPILGYGNYIGYLLVIVVGIILSVLVHKLSDRMLSQKQKS